jgi:hypothetical protein
MLTRKDGHALIILLLQISLHRALDIVETHRPKLRNSLRSPPRAAEAWSPDGSRMDSLRITKANAKYM